MVQSIIHPGARVRRSGTATVEFAVCAPVMLTIVLGLWEVGRMTEVQQVMWNCAREGARDASLGQSTLSAVTTNVTLYLQNAEAHGLCEWPYNQSDLTCGTLAGKHLRLHRLGLHRQSGTLYCHLHRHHDFHGYGPHRHGPARSLRDWDSDSLLHHRLAPYSHHHGHHQALRYCGLGLDGRFPIPAAGITAGPVVRGYTKRR